MDVQCVFKFENAINAKIRKRIIRPYRNRAVIPSRNKRPNFQKAPGYRSKSEGAVKKEISELTVRSGREQTGDAFEKNTEIRKKNY